MSNIENDDKVFKDFEREYWAPIKGYPDYRVSDLGRVKSLKQGKERILKPTPNKAGYLGVCLCNEGTKETKPVHRLVLEAFVPNPENKPEVNHKDGNKANNHFSNLEPVTRSENELHAYKTGLKTAKGSNNSQAKLSANGVLEILNMLNAGIPQPEIAAKYNVSRQNISTIKTGYSWSHVTGIAYAPRSKKPATFTPISGKPVKQSALEAWQ